MTITALPPTSGFPQGSDRLVSTRIKGVTVALPCFDWCEESHHEQDHRFVEDFSHAGRSVEVALPRKSGELEQLFIAQLFAYPHAGDGEGTKVSVDLGGECFELDQAGVEDLADQLITVASKLRGMARTIGGAA